MGLKRKKMKIKELFLLLLNDKRIKFLFIGGTTFMINYILIFLFSDVIKLESIISLSIPSIVNKNSILIWIWKFALSNISITLAFLLGTIYHFGMNKFFVFQERNISSMKYQYIKYWIMTIYNYFIYIAIINLFLFFSVSKYIGVIAATLFNTISTYFILNFLVFKIVKEKKDY
jgi:putative flippase GtrA